MRVDEFDYDLPEQLIAQEPLPERSASRMLVLYRKDQRWEDRSFNELPGFVSAGDCLVANESKVFPSRLFATRSAGTAQIEVFLLRPRAEDPLRWSALVRPGRKVPVGERLDFGMGLTGEAVERGEHGQRVIQFSGVDGDLYDVLSTIGHVPLPPYIRREDTQADRDRYQTVFARHAGSVAAPTAGLHFTPQILEACRARGGDIAHITLHVGLGTFAPLHAEFVEDVRLHSEQYSITKDAMDRIKTAKRRIAVGTTSVRAVESAYRSGSLSGETDIFIAPGYDFLAVDALLTNFHLPKSSLLMLVSAFAGREFTLAAYRHAVSAGYRFFSYGDCMLIL